MNFKTLCTAVLLMLFVGCSMPATTVKTMDTRPSISIQVRLQARYYLWTA